jgi:hypothetical protein
MNGAKPRYADQSEFFPEFEEAYDPNEHGLMLTHLGRTPKGSFGWFTLSR